MSAITEAAQREAAATFDSLGAIAEAAANDLKANGLSSPNLDIAVVTYRQAAETVRSEKW